MKGWLGVFRLSMGTRGGEASALKWKHISIDLDSVWIGESFSRGVTGSTKTKKARTVNLSPSIAAMLLARRDRLKPASDDELVFKSPEGLPIDDRNFNRRAWKTILKSCQIEYRSPYKLRHSAISHALANGANPIALAEQSGHDKRTMLSTYAHAIDREVLFVSINDRNSDNR
ncbi:site-specific integrase [Chamaesiphon sp. OTE_20_metabat_361]|uniref:tyrosine-type recombinase/integrase n=1 Tax=Chamaesiphon sp. OTE_20_metabat_361 TaxID=2964689 RepID=UPI00286C4189|nr:site-specific integrase [Chamaesiphon sp. OTE_20_metabat_361]